MDLPQTTYLHSTNLIMESASKSDANIEALIIRYTSPLGSELHKREITAEELMEISRICRSMHDIALKSKSGAYDDYYVEFVDGTGNVENVPPDCRYVVGYEASSDFKGPPTTLNVS